MIGGSDLCDYCTDSVWGVGAGGQAGPLIVPDIDREALDVLLETSPLNRP